LGRALADIREQRVGCDIRIVYEFNIDLRLNLGLPRLGLGLCAQTVSAGSDADRFQQCA
jgi:hypothetical protein